MAPGSKRLNLGHPALYDADHDDDIDLADLAYLQRVFVAP